MLQKAKNIAAGCTCGQKHEMTTSLLECRDGATEIMISYIEKNYTAKNALVVCDENTEKYAGTITRPLGCGAYVLPGDAHANEIYTEKLGKYIEENGVPSVMIACGSGSVHDIVRFCAHKIGVDFISYPTAASVDGFVSGVAAMTMYGQKLTYPSSSPVALFAEPAVFRDAPKRLTASGVGDMIGKITALFDWQVSNILTGEHLCGEIFSVMNEALRCIISAAMTEEGAEDIKFPELVMEGLLLSGLAMQLAGNSRPASGSEHHMSHFWEMHVMNEPTDALHGEKVGVGTVLMLSHIKSNACLLDKEIDIDIGKIHSERILSPVFGKLTDGIIKEGLPSGEESSALAKLVRRIPPESAEKLAKLIGSLPTADEVSAILMRVGAPTSTEKIGLPKDPEFIKRSLLFSPFVRNRLTFAKIISAVNLTEEAPNI